MPYDYLKTPWTSKEEYRWKFHHNKFKLNLQFNFKLNQIKTTYNMYECVTISEVLSVYIYLLNVSFKSRDCYNGKKPKE